MKFLDKIFKKAEQIPDVKKELENEIDSLCRETEIEFIQAEMLMNKAQELNDPVLFQKAFNKVKKIEKNFNQEYRKGIDYNPLVELTSAFGYKYKNAMVTWELLEQMSQAHIIRSIHKKIIDSVARFSKPQIDKFSTGFYFEKVDGSEITEQDRKGELKELSDFVLRCGNVHDKVTGNFEKFIREWTLSSLTYDHPPVEIIYDKAGEVYGFSNLPASTILLADTYDKKKEMVTTREAVNGEYPAYVQVIGGQTLAEFYDWEMWIGLRNPSKSILANNYGRSELEDLISITTYLLNSIKANGQVFEDGFMGSGILNIKGGASQNRLQELRQYMRTAAYGLKANQSLLVTDSEKLEWIKIRESNKDMEFSNFITFLVSVACSLYGIIPEILGLNGLVKASLNFESNFDDKIKTVLSGAIEPILVMFSEGFTDKIISKKCEGKYRFCFGGIHAETQMQYLDKLTKKAKFCTLNEIRKEMGLPEMPKGQGDFVMDSMYMQYLGLKQQEAMMQQQGGQEQGQEQGGEDQFSEGLMNEDESPETEVEKSQPDELKNYFQRLIIEGMDANKQDYEG